jgi:hypothetical protein
VRRLLVVLALLAGVVAVGVLATRGGDRELPSAAELAPGATSAKDFAAASCLRLRFVEQGVRANSSADAVRRSLAEARVLAAEASVRDPLWVPLSGGVAALDEAVRRDDPRAADIGLQSARAACLPR